MSADRPNLNTPLFMTEGGNHHRVVGADVHKRSHTFVAIDEVGRKLGEKTVKATTDGHRTAVLWAHEQFGTELLWGIEDCRNMSARLERDLLGVGQKVVRVPTKLMAATRKSARTRGKSDPIDARLCPAEWCTSPDLISGTGVS
ncbi:transposase-like protein [Mycolicibacterium brisbanense]|uniref:Transposase-like protein n=1 Tax=Mycolicibacterium brisbanense TaxID=146020 RepID=A0A100W315_9MYCO|nr:transposase-like protein [Mycolicibacterium brisbanense]